MSRIFTPALLALALSSTALSADDLPRTITVSGTGEVATAPDIARISVGVTSHAKTAADALAQMNTQAGAVLERLMTTEGIDKKDVQTGQLSLQPRYQDGKYGHPDGIIGFQAETSLDVILRDLSKVGGLLDTLVTDGANTLSGLSFDVADPEPLLDEARRKAVQKARAKAELYATAAGVELGPVVTISEQGGYSGPHPKMEMMAMARADVPIAEGEVGLSASVTIVYELEGGD